MIFYLLSLIKTFALQHAELELEAIFFFILLLILQVVFSVSWVFSFSTPVSSVAK